MTTNLFVYGTLMFPEIWGTLVKADYQSAAASLPGYRRTRIVGDCYPVIRPTRHGGFVTGQIYWHVNSADLRRLDLFEGPWYQRCRVRAFRLSQQRRPVQAFAYVLRDRYRHLASVHPWNVSKARQACRQKFLNDTDQRLNAHHPAGHPTHRMEKT